MRLSISAHLDYMLSDETDVLLQLEAADSDGQHIVESSFRFARDLAHSRIAAQDEIGRRLWLNASGNMICDYAAIVDVTRIMQDVSALKVTALPDLPADVVPYILPSRYCPSDEFQTFASSEFDGLEGGARIAAMRDWIEAHFTYVHGVSNAQTTALDSFVQRQGICRDFAHVLITLARASAIPARMASVYAHRVVPPDFHAVADIYLDGNWHLVDPTGMARADEMARIVVGRDAADIAFMTSFKPVYFNAQWVNVSVAAG